MRPKWRPRLPRSPRLPRLREVRPSIRGAVRVACHTKMWRRWAVRAAWVAATLVGASATKVLYDSYMAYADVCEQVPLMFMYVIPASLFGIEATMPRNPTWCVILTRAVSPGILLGFVEAYLDAALALASSSKWTVLTACACAAFALKHAWRRVEKRTFSKKHAGVSVSVPAVTVPVAEPVWSDESDNGDGE